MLSSYFVSPKTLEQKKYKKQTNQQINNRFITKQDIHTQKMKKRKLKPIACEKISCLHQSLTFLFFKKKSRVFSVTRKQHVSNIKRTSYHEYKNKMIRGLSPFILITSSRTLSTLIIFLIDRYPLVAQWLLLVTASFSMVIPRNNEIHVNVTR